MQKQGGEDVIFTGGRIFVKGNLSVRGKRERAAYILYYGSNILVVIIEAKDSRHSKRCVALSDIKDMST